MIDLKHDQIFTYVFKLGKSNKTHGTKTLHLFIYLLRKIIINICV